MFGWFYKLFAANRFKSQSRLAFGLIRAFKELILARIEEIITSTQSNYIKVAEHYNRYYLLNNSLEECHYNKDEFDYVTKYNDPIITPAQESRLRFLRKLYWLSIVVFFVVETILFFMIAQNITGGIVSQLGSNRTLSNFIPYFLFAASAIFALLCAFMLDAGLRQLLYFFKAKKHYDKKFIDIAMYRTAIVKVILGATLIIGSVVVLFLMNWARSYAIDATGSNSSSHNPILVYALIALSIFAGIAFGVVKKELAENSELLNLASKWNKIRKEMGKVHSDLTELSIRIHNKFSLTINKSLALGVDLQELMEREYDERDTELLTEFRKELKNGKFHISNADGTTQTVLTAKDAYYYNNLTTNEFLLHNNHFATNERLLAIIQDVDRMVTEVNDMEKKRLSKLKAENATSNNNSLVHTAANEQNTELINNENAKPELSTTNSENIFSNAQVNNHKNNHSINETLINQ